MMEWVRRSPWIALLTVLAIALAAVIAAEAVLGSHAATRVAPGGRAAPAEAKLLPPLTVASAEQAYPETAARPLFIPTRRPAPEAPAAGKNSFQKGQYVLQGVIAVGDNRVAMLKEKSTGKIHRVQAGNDMNGVKVAQIEAEQVTLTAGADREVIPLLVQKGQAGKETPGSAAGLFPAQHEPAPAAAVNPAGNQTHVPGQPFAAPPPLQPGQTANPLTRPQEAAPAALTPEELLARRRARRALPGQIQPQ
jgi:hypothetical protein